MDTVVSRFGGRAGTGRASTGRAAAPPDVRGIDDAGPGA